MLPMIFFMLFCVLSSVVLAIVVLQENYLLDSWISIHASPGWMLVMEQLSNLASKPVIISLLAISVVALWLFKKDYIGIAVVVVFVIGGNYFNKFLKGIIQRERPVVEGHIVEGYSFPSGHVMVGLIMYGLIAFFIYYYSTKLAVKVGSFIVITSILLLMGISRIVLQEHYVTDVLAGYTVGGFLLITAILTYQYIQKKNTKR